MVKTAIFKLNLHLWKEGEVRRSQIWRVEWMRKWNHAVSGKKLTCEESSVRVHYRRGASSFSRVTDLIAFAECLPVFKPGNTTRYWWFGPWERIPECTMRMSKKTMSIHLVELQTCLAFFGRGDDGFLHCEDCCFVSGSYPYVEDHYRWRNLSVRVRVAKGVWHASKRRLPEVAETLETLYCCAREFWR